MITVQTSYKVSVQIDQEAFQKYSTIFQNMPHNPRGKDKLKIDCKDDILYKINQHLVFWRHNQPPVIPKPIPNSKISTFLRKEDVEFIQSFDDPQFCELVRASILMGIQHMENLCYAVLASRFIGRTVNEFVKEQELDVQYNQELESKIQKNYAAVLNQQIQQQQ